MNSYEIKKIDDKYVAVSKYYDGGTGTGSTPNEAVEALRQKLIYIRDNDKVAWKKGIAKQKQEIGYGLSAIK